MFLKFLTFQLVFMLMWLLLARASEITKAEENVIERVEIDFRSLLFNSNSKNQPQTFLYKLDKLSNFDIRMSRLYSNQLDEKTMRDFFTLENKTQILVAKELTREKLCLQLKSCGTETSATSDSTKCILNLNLILYLSPNEKSSNKNLNLIKIVKINLIVSNLSDDYLQFERQMYEFNLNASSNNVGFVRAFSSRNSDLNGLIKYYIVSNSVSSNGFQIDEKTGILYVNDTTRVINQSKIEFFVDAFMQCSFLRPLKNRTLVRVNFVNYKQYQPKLSVTNLIETKQLTNTLECFKLTKNDLSNNVSIPLAQLQVEDSDSANAILFNINILPKNLSNILQVDVKKLIDNIYVVYLSLSNRNLEYRQMFLTDLFQIDLRLINSNFIIEKMLHLCINIPNIEENLHEELSLVQFEKSVYVLEMDKSVEVNVLNLDKANSIGFSIDNENENFKLDVQPGANSSSFVLKIKSVKSNMNFPEILQYSMTGIAFKGTNETRNMAEIYNDMNRLSVKNRKFMSFVCKIIFNTERNTIVNDSSSYMLGNQEGFYAQKFYVKLDDLVNNSIIGYLPNIYSLTNSTNNVTHFSYMLSNSSIQCFRINKYTGVLTFNELSKNLSELNCYKKELYPLKLDVNLISNYGIVKHASILIHDVSLKSNEKDAPQIYQSFYEINSNFVNIIYEPSKIEFNQINKTFVDTFNLNFKFSFEFKKTQPGLIKLVNLVSNFKNEQDNFQTKFELSNKLENLYLMDTKKASLYINLEKLTFSGKSTKCTKLSLVAKNFIYKNSISRQLESMDRFNLNLCLMNGIGQQSKIIELENLNISYNSFITPILLNGGNDVANFDYLIENSLLQPNFFFSFLYVSLSFSVLSAFLILIVAFICRKNVSKKSTSLSNQNLESQRFYSNFQSSSFTSTSTSSDISSELKIRNDLSKTSLQKSIENNQLLVPSLYQHVNISTQKQDARVPSCNHTVKMLNDSFNTSSTRIENEEQGVYCIATGMSFSLTSNISSVTNSQFVDDNYQMNIGSPVSSSSSSDLNYIASSRFHNTNCTKLSLFDLTPNHNRLVKKNHPVMKLEEKKEIIENNIEMDENMKKWIFINYNFNCNSDLIKEKNKPTLLDTSCAISNVLNSNSLNECII